MIKLMDNKYNVHVGLGHPSNYTHLVRNAVSGKDKFSRQPSKVAFNLSDDFGTLNHKNSKFNITVGRFNPKIKKFTPRPQTSILKQSKSDVTSSSSSIQYPQESNLENLTSLSSYDFSKFGTNSTSKLSPAGSFGRKSVTFSSVLVSSSDTLGVQTMSSFGSQNNSNLSKQSSHHIDSEQETLRKTYSAGRRDLLGVFRSVVKNVINVNRLANLRSDYASGFLGAESLENVGFGDYVNNQESINIQSSIADEPLMNKASTDSISQIVMLNRKSKSSLNSNFGVKLSKIKQKYQFVQGLLDDLGDPLKLLKNDEPLSNILDEQVNTSRLIHPFYINYYPKKQEIVEEEFDSQKLCKSSANEKRNFRMEDYPSLLSVRN
ncbi:conserved hypothetical protein [Theileria orientalis strain Shintoku]|uniref:Uncharacterized protein n=1 Tax=Theileria orientalis strain Shintoku TaxID=869250 RepID=J4CDV9_THEOR|nr:conserved hypothetical protein [Theileria orientalis strain Shintoku]BAM41822.1 conserved hypothetical protein [Theileria orientalis strain Shintoku]|eukprot:XP_009692123.1 conserved hypothetical protein [Theileria orientalis strain Shintoku]